MAQADFNENTFARLINIAGRQRMLSQRVGFLSVVLNARQTDGPSDRLTTSDHHLDMLKAAADDFETGFKILCEGDKDLGLPHWECAEVAAILNGRDGIEGHAVINRFVSETRHTIATLEAGKTRRQKELEDFSTFVLTDTLAVLQKIVGALEADFQAATATRDEQRTLEIDRVRTAVEDIQRASKISRMIALNAKISATRAGSHGSEFRALTDEIKKISDDITQSSEDIIRFLNIA
ncbi:type IV pili methyl-accepting chemotaxis transducer N-terminal domain-containing protein [Labrenzia sp. R4_2]|uniref:type IV pili methyl-accepting chemotaxis transducer N-terminal domain-containing protein n=1 Tax=Labrenzia sp. R4_2 TaxID=2821107 RepID=UPI001ADC0DD3|nr:type IV pili methyl-accepting chemotaxis transducer N-terminal domain-containing protein [Labrenzia sp. R4_2]MBO9418356.1 type IV pili methyl-accepting chemotaxis transducer N-terminal domain-containing protein [Labrenzia sp. R4_2]